MNATTQTGIVSEVTLSYSNKTPAKDRVRVTDSSIATSVMRPRFEPFMEHHEEFHILLMNKGNQVLGSFKVCQGGLDACIVDPRLVYQAALLANASSLILFHNHPSGNLNPSQHDINLTKLLIDAGNLLEIKVLDHIILTSESEYSLADNGIGF